MRALRFPSLLFLLPAVAAASPIVFGAQETAVDLEARVSVWGNEISCSSRGSGCAVDTTTASPPPYGSAWAAADVNSVAAAAHAGDNTWAYARASTSTLQTLIFLGATGSGTAEFDVEGTLAGDLPGNASFSINGQTVFETGGTVTLPILFNEPFTLETRQELIVSAWAGEGGLSRGNAHVAVISVYDSAGRPVDTPEPHTVWTGSLIICVAIKRAGRSLPFRKRRM